MRRVRRASGCRAGVGDGVVVLIAGDLGICFGGDGLRSVVWKKSRGMRRLSRDERGGCVRIVNFTLCLEVEQCAFVLRSPHGESHQHETPFGPSKHARKAAICQQHIVFGSSIIHCSYGENPLKWASVV